MGNQVLAYNHRLQNGDIMTNKLDNAIEVLKNVIADDYVGWTNTLDIRTDKSVEVKRDEFKGKLSIAKGKKYWKVIADHSCWGFIVATDGDKLFKKGDILFSAGWSKPARNAPRGNILDGNFTGVRWTGPAYLR